MSKPKITRYTASNSKNQDERIEHDILQLSLEGMLPFFKEFSRENIANHDTPKNYLEALLEKHRAYKEDIRIKSKIKQAKFGEIKTIEKFDFKKQPNVNKQQILDLATCAFITEKKNIIFLGQAGVGKTHLAKGLGMEAIIQGKNVRFIGLQELVDSLTYKYTDGNRQHWLLESLERPELLILDEVRAIKDVTPNIQDFLYRLICQRYQNKSTIFTSNKDFSEWEQLFGNTAGAALDRILDKEYRVIIKIEGESQRVALHAVTL